VSNNLTVNHILVSKAEKIIYLSCRDEDGRIHLYCIYDSKLVKTHNRNGWQIINQVLSERVMDLADQYIHKSPTYDVYNIVSQFVN
ncbi:MAG: hypothetical protein KAJ14_13370, partial [Candidatus Omnitrophica bacterium]|nr:hypothetical protein [Candidatus Omnitrophota bacterium]